MAKPSGGSFVGLDIGTQTIKVVEVRGAGNGLQISALGVENTPPGAVQGGLVADPKALGTAIKSLLGKSGIGAKKTVSAAAGAASVVVRVIEVPRMSPAELAETMKWEVERHIPFAANDVEISYQAIDSPAGGAPDPNNPNMEVLLAVAQRDMVAQHIETLQAAGLNPVAIDVEPLAAGRALINLSKTGLASKNVVVVNIGASNTDVGIFKDGILRFPRTIPLAGDNLTRAIADHLGLSMDAAEDEKRENAAVLIELIGSTAPSNPFDEGSSPDASGGGAMQTPFDIPINTPFAERPAQATVPPPSSFDVSDTNAGSATSAGGMPTFDISDAPSPPVGGGASVYPSPDENPFATPFPSDAPPAAADSPFVDASPAAPPPAPIADDPRSLRRREVFDAILPVLGEFVMELRRSIDYFRSRYPNDVVDQIILCGGSAHIANLDQFVQNDLNIPTIVADPFAGVTVSSKQMSRERLQQLAPDFAVAVGLAARDALLGSGK